MKALQELWRDNPYMVAAAVIAPIVFAVVFALIWVLLSGSSGANPTEQVGSATAQVEQTTTPARTVVQVQSDDEQQSEGAAVSSYRDRPSPEASQQSTAPAAQQEGSSQAGQTENPDAEEQVGSEPLPDLQGLVHFDIADMSNFRYGLEEERGAILPIDNGIVPSSGPNHTTTWQLLLPTARIHADIVSLGRTPRGAIGAPDNPFVVGWFNISAAPGEPGNSILAGHRDYEDIDGNVGSGVCWELDRVETGDQMVVRDAERSIAFVYEIIEKVVLDPNQPDSARYLADTEEPIITLITCTGSFNPTTHNYSHRLVIVGLLQATASA